MFEPTDHPRVFAVPLGVDFPRALVRGLTERSAGDAPEALAQVQLLVNTRRMARRISELFDEGPARLLPRVGLVTDPGSSWPIDGLPPTVSPLRRRFELLQLVAALLDQQPDLAPRSAIYDLADSLAGLMDEMHGEGVSPDVIDALDITDQSGHWERIQSFLGIVRDYFSADGARPDAEARHRLAVERLAAQWQARPPGHPVIVAGSTGSRGTTQILMQAVARLPQGALVLPGYDTDMPDAVWEALDDPMLSEDHPQYRFVRLLRELGLRPDQVTVWTGDAPANPPRNRLLSLALRPAPITDQWRRDGPRLNGIDAATRDVTLLEAPSQRIEALAIAMRLRQAAEDGQAAALITPDRVLGRQVTAALDRWGILPDDSAGVPLHLSLTGRFLRQVAELFSRPLSAESLLTLLKNPLTHSGAPRGPHLRLSRELELHLRRHGPPYPDADSLATWATGIKGDEVQGWTDWLVACFTGQQITGDRPLQILAAYHMDLAERIAHGPAGLGSSRLWEGDDGQQAQKTVTELIENAPNGGNLGTRDYASLFHAIFLRESVRAPVKAHPLIKIWGTLEARVQGADLLIIGGLNEGSWPEAPRPDPWLNRDLRRQAGLLLPERRIGLSAHDFQQAFLAREVWVARSIRSDDAETVPSRWLNRLQNLLSGLPDQGGPEALKEMRARGVVWLKRAEALEATLPAAPATRPSPCPPPEARPRQLSVTQIQRLIRDPYAIYARHVLRLYPLDPLMKVPDALLRGIALHKALEIFIRDTRDTPENITRDRLMQKTVSVLAETVPWAATRAMWRARMERVADRFVEGEIARRLLAGPAAFEAKGEAALEDLGFTLTATADRLDIDRGGNLHLYDYKTGQAPSEKEQRHFDKQLLLEAAIAERAGFGELPAAPVARAVFISLGSGKPEEEAPLDTEPPEKVWQELHRLISAYLSPGLGFTSRRAMQKSRHAGEYDQLARFGEWDITDDPDPQEVGR